MSDAGRKGFTDSTSPPSIADYHRTLLMHHAEASEAMTPDSQKSTGQKLSEGATDITDKVSRSVKTHTFH